MGKRLDLPMLVRALFLLLAAWVCIWGDLVVDDFEKTGAPAAWVFGNGPEFPGAIG